MMSYMPVSVQCPKCRHVHGGAAVLAGCPVPNELWNASVFSTDILISQSAPLLSSADPSDPCTVKVRSIGSTLPLSTHGGVDPVLQPPSCRPLPLQAQAVASCALDGSLTVQRGCCSSAYEMISLMHAGACPSHGGAPPVCSALLRVMAPCRLPCAPLLPAPPAGVRRR